MLHAVCGVSYQVENMDLWAMACEWKACERTLSP